MSVRVLLVDDHKMLREGLRAILTRTEGVSVAGEASDGRAAVQLARELAPDVIVMDVVMAGLGGIEATHQIAAELPGIGVIALSSYSDKRYVRNMFEAGASGYVLKVSAHDELLDAVRAVAGGKSYVSPEIAGIVLEGFVGERGEIDVRAGRVLGSREREVLQLVAEGKTSSEIAGLLHVSTRTVEAHRQSIMRKLDLHSVAELTKYAIREGLTSLEERNEAGSHTS